MFTQCLVQSWPSVYNSLMRSDTDTDGFDERLRHRTMAKSHPLDTIPTDTSLRPRGAIPNTPLAVSAVSFLLGSIFALGFLTFAVGGFQRFWWSTYELGFFVASWAVFHWGEFAVTAGWNKDKCSVDCEFPSVLTAMIVSIVIIHSISLGKRHSVSHSTWFRRLRVPGHLVLLPVVQEEHVCFSDRCVSVTAFPTSTHE